MVHTDSSKTASTFDQHQDRLSSSTTVATDSDRSASVRPSTTQSASLTRLGGPDISYKLIKKSTEEALTQLQEDKSEARHVIAEFGVDSVELLHLSKLYEFIFFKRTYT